MKTEKLNTLLDSYSKERVSSSEVEQAERKAKNLGTRIADFKLLLRMFKDGISGRYRLSIATLAAIGGAIAYVASPVDFFPDFLFPIGYTDDIAVIGIVMNQLADEIKKYKAYINYK